MAKFRRSQKEFGIPLIGALAKGGLEKATSLLFAGSSVAGIAQGAKGNKLMQQQNEEMKRQALEQQKIEQQRLKQEQKWQQEQLKLQKKALKQGVNPFGDSSILNNTTGTPTTPLQAPPAIYQNNYSNKQKEYSVFSIAAGFGKDMSLLALRNRGALVGGVFTGAAMTGGAYIADKAVREDMKKTKDKKSERTYSVKRISLKGPVFSFALGMAAPAISYAAEKEIERDMLEDTKEEKGEKPTPKFREKSFAVKSPNKVLNVMSLLSGGGGAKGVRNLGIQISAIGKKSGNKWTQKLGQAIIDNPNSAMVASIPGGLILVSGGVAVGDRVATEIAKKADKEAFDYIDSKEEEIE